MATYAAYRHIELDKVGAGKKRNIKKNTSVSSSDSESDEDYMPSCKERKDGENVSEENSDTSEDEDDKQKQKKVPVNQPTPAPLKAVVKSPPLKAVAKRPPIGGLSSVLGQIGKKSKLSVLEKSKLDWNNFKKEEGIEEDLKTYNKGKNGYLEKQDFLQRTDLRQFEIEKTMRSSSRRLK